MKTAIYAGSFDPVTNGHIDILEKASKLFDTIIVPVVHNVSKKALFTLSEREELLKASTWHLDNIEVDSFSGLLADYVRKRQACAIIRGLRTVADFEYEMHMAMMNKELASEADTVFIVADNRYIYVSSSIVKEVCFLGGDINGLVPPPVYEALLKKAAMVFKR